MAVEFTWSTDHVERRTSDNTITAVLWRCTATNGIDMATTGGVAWPAWKPQSPFSEITDDAILQRVHQILDPRSVEASLAAQMTAQANQAIEVRAPRRGASKAVKG